MSEPTIFVRETIDRWHRVRNLSKLTAKNRSSFTFEWKIHEQDYGEYKEQEGNCEKLNAWVTDTVDYGLRPSSCLPTWDVKIISILMNNSIISILHPS
jgi:hypothetical protein